MANTANIQSLSITEIQSLLANTVANSTLTTDFNVTPYYDDYTTDKEYYRILYKPGYAVQARELTQQQTIQQQQISRFGHHVFKEGSIVIPGQFSIEKNIDYVKIKDIDNSNNAVTMSNFINETVVGQTNGITAFVIEIADGTEADTLTKTLFVRYLSGSTSNTAAKIFAPGEILVSNNGTALALSSAPTGKGSRFVISEGVVFAKDHFVSFPTSSIILSRYSDSPTCRVGFNIDERIVSSDDDLTLLDPALESSNYSAPGADRLKLVPTLQVLDIADNTGAPNFVELFTIDNAIVTEKYERTQYNILKDELAKRTMDESGDYYVDGMTVRIRENYDDGTNGGYSTNGSIALLSVGVEPGTAYVKGYEVGIVGKTKYLTTPKSNTYSNVSTQIATATMGDYVRLNEFTGYINHDQGNVILLKDRANKRLSNAIGSTATGVGNTIGTARVLSVVYDSGLLGSPAGIVDVYLSDIRMNGTNSFTSVKSLYTSGFGGDLTLDKNGFGILNESTQKTLLYYTGAPATKTLRDTSGAGSMVYTFQRTDSISLSSAGQGSISIATAGETFPYGTVASLSAADKRDIMLSLDSSANISGPGTVSANSGNGNTFTLTGGSAFFSRMNVGDKIEIAGKSNTFTIASITSDASLTTDQMLPPSLTGNSWFKAYKTGDIVDMTGIGFTAGATRTIAATSSQLTFDIKTTIGGTGITGKVTYQAARTTATEATKTLTPNRYVAINCATAGTTGPFCLGFSDIYQIRNIIKKTGSAPASLTDGTDVTANFILDNGQRDNSYELGAITPNGIALGATDRLLVRLDYFTPGASRKGYFSIDSYPIPAEGVVPTANTQILIEDIPTFTSPVNGIKYDLRNYIDFRPMKTITAADATTVGAATTNPANSSSYIYDTNGMRMVTPSTQFTYDYSYYNARRDLVVIDKEGNLSIIEGLPASSPITPAASENTMTLAALYITPYPSIAPNYGQLINRRDLACNIIRLSNIRYTMRDIGVLERRIENLEYYAALTLLEKAAIELRVVDTNGNDRFKNGIFVDNFVDHSLGATSSADYKIVVDPVEKSIRPVFNQQSTYYDLDSVSNATKTGDLITLPYTEATLIEQPRVTSYRNLEYSSYRFIGSVILNPETDNWVDIEQAPDEQISIGPMANNLPQGALSTTWNSWQTSVTGFPIEGGTNEVTTSTRTGSETFATGITQTQEKVAGSNKIIDVGLKTYIRPQVIYVTGLGLKANTPVNVFFDGENMTQYCTQISAVDLRPTSNTFIASNVSSAVLPVSVASAIRIGAEGFGVTSDRTGTAYMSMRLPAEKKFRVGTKEVIVTDSPTNSFADATSYGKGYFLAQGTVVTKQETTLTTRHLVTEQRAITESVSSSRVVAAPIFVRPDNDCSAYSFLPKAPDGEEGIFLTSVDVFFAKKHPTLGVWFELRQMDSGGTITRNQIPLSEVWLTSNEMNVSADASISTKVKFRSPIFLYSNVQYAFVMHAVGANPDTYLWVSRIGEVDVKTGQQVNARSLTGTYYTTNNNLNWNIVEGLDLCCKFNRASFSTGITGQAVISNRPNERLILGNVTTTFSNYGEFIYGRSKLTMSGNTAVINVGDYLIGSTSNANSAVISNTSTVIVANNRFVAGETVRIYSSAMVLRPQTSLVSSVVTAGATITQYKQQSGKTTLDVTSSNGNFVVGDTITSSVSGSTATVDNIENIRYSVVNFAPTYLNFNKTFIQFQMMPTSNAGTVGSYENINDGSNYYFNNEKAIYSRSNEIASLSGAKSNKILTYMTSASEFMSPVLDLGRTQLIYVDNLINANTTGETNSSGGGLFNKYISRTVTLAEGQDSEDLRVILTAYRPPTSDVKVYAKILQGEDSDPFSAVPWIEMETDYTEYSSLSDRNDFKEYTYTFPASYLTGASGQVQYTNSKGVVETGFKYFAIKIGLTGTNSAVVPRVGDLRVLALQI